MQIRFIHPPSSLDIQNAIHDWLELLARENYDEAYAYTSHDPYYEWTPELMKEVINGYGLPSENTKSTKYKVTDLKTALFDPAPRTPEITFYNNPQKHWTSNFKIIGDVLCYLPLNGKWSDLSATFIILEATDYFTLELNEIHVL